MKPWDGRFSEVTHDLVERFTASIHIDKRLYLYDIIGSIAHAEMLEKQGLISEEEKRKIVKALEEIKEEIEGGVFNFSEKLEDIHMHIEARLVEKIGEPGRKLHTGRSRNDQVSLDTRLFLRHELKQVEEELLELMRCIIRKAETEKDAIMPGFTHLQKAQIVPFSHYILSYYFMFKRDRERLKNALRAVDAMPLGSGALAGSTLPLDREYLRERLGFSRITENSMDTVSDRDFILDTLYAFSMIMIHLSRLCEDLIIFSSDEFSFFKLPERLLTGSSIMPHKRNPDVLELIRGKTSRVIGDLLSLLILFKGLSSTYNRDLQEDKEALFHALDITKASLSIMVLCIKEMQLNRKGMEDAIQSSYIEATEIAEYLVAKGMPFRDAHKTVGRMVKECERRGIKLKDLKIEELKSFCQLFEEDIYELMDPYKIITMRKTTGGASFREVEIQIEREKAYLDS
ncbi:MAG: argininosuccinate lyase [Deltaproteobacteria bacterium]|nr:argininosuccinate lyase [Deltaproteobacteria bacterium]